MMFERLRSWLGLDRPGDIPDAPEGACSGPSDGVGCREALDHLYEYLDGELEGASPAEIEEHFRICSACYPHLLCEQAFRDAVRRAVSRQGADAGLRARLLEALEREGLEAG